MIVLNIIQFVELKLVNLKLWGIKTPFTSAQRVISEHHKIQLSDHKGSPQ